MWMPAMINNYGNERVRPAQQANDTAGKESLYSTHHAVRKHNGATNTKPYI